jgi:hypothetical protein
MDLDYDMKMLTVDFVCSWCMVFGLQIGLIIGLVVWVIRQYNAPIPRKACHKCGARFLVTLLRCPRCHHYLCPKCNYNLVAHKKGQRCPECGTDIEY